MFWKHTIDLADILAWSGGQRFKDILCICAMNQSSCDQHLPTCSLSTVPSSSQLDISAKWSPLQHTFVCFCCSQTLWNSKSKIANIWCVWEPLHSLRERNPRTAAQSCYPMNKINAPLRELVVKDFLVWPMSEAVSSPKTQLANEIRAIVAIWAEPRIGRLSLWTWLTSGYLFSA